MISNPTDIRKEEAQELITPRGKKTNKAFNALLNGTSIVRFGRLPVKLYDTEEYGNDTLESSIKKINWTGRSANFQNNRFMVYNINVPNAQVNDITQEITITFIADKDMDNYILMNRWLDVVMSLEYRKDKNGPELSKYWDGQRAWCEYLDIQIGDNVRKPIAILRFKHLFCTSIGDVFVDFTTSSPISFDCKLKFNTFEIINDPDEVENTLVSYKAYT